MKKRLMFILVVCLLVFACAPSAEIRRLESQPGIQKSGNIELFHSFEAVEKPYRRVAEIAAVDKRSQKKRNKDQTIEALKNKARDVGADAVVITEEGTFKRSVQDPMGGTILVDTMIIKGVAIIFE